MILVTGATGNIGRELVRLLVMEGKPVRALVRSRARARALLGDGAELFEGDLADPGAIDAALRGIERLYLLSPDPRLEGPVVDAAARVGVRRLVKSSALAFDLEPPPVHLEIEARIEASGFAFTHLRPGAFMQSLAGYLPVLLGTGDVLRLPAGTGRTAWIDARDIAAVAARVLVEDGHEGQAYALTGPEALTMHEVAQVFGARLGREIRYEDTPADQARAWAEAAGMPAAMAGFLMHHYESVRAGGFERVTDTIPRIIGRKARTLGDFLGELDMKAAGPFFGLKEEIPGLSRAGG